MAIKKKKSNSRPSPNGHRNGRRPANSRGAADAPVRRAAGNATDFRTYSIPDLRLEHPDFTVKQVTEKDGPTRPLRSRRRPQRSRSADPRLEISDQAAAHRDLPLHAAQPQNGGRARKSLQARQGRRRSLFRPRPGSLLLRLGLRARQRRLVRAHDPQPGIAARPRISAPRHHDAVHGQGRLAHQGPRRHHPLRRHRKAQHGFAHLHARRSDPRALRRRAGRAPARTQHRRHDLHRRRRPVHRRHL